MKELFESSYISVMMNENMKLREELQKKDNIINTLKDWLNYSIDKINQKLIINREIIVKDGIVMNMNDYQVLRLKSFRRKMEDVLDKIKELEKM